MVSILSRTLMKTLFHISLEIIGKGVSYSCKRVIRMRTYLISLKTLLEIDEVMLVTCLGE